MACFICATCGTQFAESGDQPPELCPICEDERQFVPPSGQAWTILERLRRGHRNSFERCEPGLYGIGTVPEFGIGQRALLIRTGDGNVLWDCIALVDDATVDLIGALGGLKAIAISHPHFYTTMVEWSRAFGDVPIHLHEDDREWVMRPAPAVRFWGGERMALGPGLTLIRCGGHFEGSSVLHWAGGATGAGALLTGDTVSVAEDARWVSFMRSYPNRLPLSAGTVRRIGEALEPFAFERIYGGFWGWVVANDAKAALRRSVVRYVQAIED
ncbi:MAG TPA: MBL fold metallo-hydrolase [Alphaproteobacteria bacterium]|nr:MBL fold metallo-hydrolase [Alphaproteobacteria bacterium]